MDNRLVSVIMPLYNAEAYVSEAIESVLKQNYSPLELIIVDDGSSDKSLEIALQYQSDNVRVFSQPNSGACVARNKGLREARGEYIKFLDADDILAPDSIAKQVGQIMSLTDKQIPFGDYDYINSQGQFINSFTFDSVDFLNKDQVYFFFNKTEILISAPLHRKTLLDEVGGFDESFKRGQESDLHFRLALSGVKFVYFPCNTFSYRSHNSPSKITNRSYNGSIDLAAYWEMRHKKCERLLITKYGYIPEKYSLFLSKYWFDKAREMFAFKEKEKGLIYIEKVKNYPIISSFAKRYIKIGNIIGYLPLEKIFRFRLKLVGKAQ